MIRAKQARDANKRMVSFEKNLEKMAPKVVAVMTCDGGDYDASDLRDFLGEVCEQLREEERARKRGVRGGGEVVSRAEFAANGKSGTARSQVPNYARRSRA